MGSGRTLALVVAHPDDDAYGVAGTVALHAADPDFRFVLVHATDGGAGDIRDGFPATRETLGAIRRGECEAAWRAHGRLPDRHEWLDYPDGAVDQMPFSELVDRIAAILAEEEPRRGGHLWPRRHHRPPRPHHRRRGHRCRIRAVRRG
jgi:LmbE family N-acetylglucosaminyl deacetylase